MRGTTTKQIVGLLRRAGAAEVHLRISAPPIFHPCFYGIDTSIETELIASTHSRRGDPRRSSAPIRWATCRSAACSAALDLPYDQFCFACFDGDVPGARARTTSRERKFMLEDAGRERPR